MSIERQYGESYAEYNKHFTVDSHPVNNSAQTPLTLFFTIVLLLVAFGSLASTLLGDIRNKKFATYLVGSIVASVSIGYSAIDVMNYVGVYI